MSDEAGKTPSPAAPAVPVPATGQPGGGAAASAPVGIEDFQRLQFKIGTIQAAIDHPNANRLLVLTVDIGEAAPRQIVAGIRGAYEPSALVGTQVVVVANLKPAVLRGVESQGMVLAGSDATGLALMRPERALGPGTQVK